jgi:hypothetical protein
LLFFHVGSEILHIQQSVGNLYFSHRDPRLVWAILGQLQLSFSFGDPVMVQITGEGSDPETISTVRLVTWVKDEEADSLQLLSSKNVISHKCCSPLSLSYFVITVL